MKAILTKLAISGELHVLVKCGIVPPKILFYYQIWQEVDKQQRTTSKGRMQIITEVSDVFKVSHTTVYTALKLMS